MARGVAQYLVGSIVLVALAACNRTWFAERDAWRHDAEAECLKSGAVKEGPAIVQLRPIQGPGVCGADFPLKVTGLGENPALGFADDPRPPGAIPQYSPVPAARRAAPAPMDVPPPYGAPPPYGPGAAPGNTPMPITPPGVDPAGPGTYATGPYDRPAYGAPPGTYPAQQPAPVETVPLAPARGIAVTASASVTPAATLACPLVSALDIWMATGVQPAAQRWFGQPVVEIKQISAYSCRSMNSQRGAPISEHAFGNALDIAAFTFADGRKVTVREGWHGLPEERAFLHDVQASACRLFSTVLAPGSNAFHYDHMHVDLARRTSGRAICNPASVPGDLIAGARGPLVTGSVASRPARPPTNRPVSARAPADERFLPIAVPGED
jgi:hypothetical protein